MKIPKIKPRSKQVLVKQDSEESRVSENGIVTPNSVDQEKKSTGVVIEVGGDIKDLKKNQRVIFGTYAGEIIKFKDVEYRILFDEDVLAILED